MFYNCGKLLSYNAFINMVMSNRGGGKTYNSLKRCIIIYKKSKKQFIYIRRYKKEFEEKALMFDALKEEFPNDELTVKGMKMYINGECMGYLVALSISLMKKSTPYPNVTTIIFDEFVIDKKGTLNYLSNEVRAFLEFISTVTRSRDDVKVIMLANAITISNPYFMYWNIEPNNGKRFNVYKNGLICVELFTDNEFIDKMKQTKFGKLVDGTSYGDYALENKFLLDNKCYVEKKTSESKYFMALKYKGETHGFWIDYNCNRIYVNNRKGKNNYNTYSLTTDDMEYNTLLLPSLKKSVYMKRVLFALENGLIRFDTINVKNVFFDYIKLFTKI